MGLPKKITMPLHPNTLASLEKLIITEFLGGGPKDGHTPEIGTTDEMDKIAFSTWTPRRDSYRRPKSSVSNRLYWKAIVQDTWPTSVERRGLACVDGHPILFARRLSTTRWETFEVVALQRGLGFDATAVRGFVLRLGACITFDPDRQRAIKRLRAMVRKATVAKLEGGVFA